MNIALINQFFPPAQAPTGLLLHDLARALADRGHRVTVLASAGRYGAAGADGEYGLPGVRVQRLGSARPHRSGFVSKALDYALFYLRVNRALRRLDPAPDAVVCQTTPPFIGLAAARLRARRGVPYVLWCMDLYPEALASHGSLRSGFASFTAVVLDRPRHKELIQQIRQTGARIQLIGDGDVAAAIACCNADSGVDILFGVGGAPEGVIAAAAMRCMGGDFQGILRPRHQEEIDRARKMGIEDINKVFFLEDLARGPVMFAATGVTTGTFLRGVQFRPWGAITHSVVMRSQSGTVRTIVAEHHFDKKPQY